LGWTVQSWAIRHRLPGEMMLSTAILRFAAFSSALLLLIIASTLIGYLILEVHGGRPDLSWDKKRPWIAPPHIAVGTGREGSTFLLTFKNVGAAPVGEYGLKAGFSDTQDDWVQIARKLCDAAQLRRNQKDDDSAGNRQSAVIDRLQLKLRRTDVLSDHAPYLIGCAVYKRSGGWRTHRMEFFAPVTTINGKTEIEYLRALL